MSESGFVKDEHYQFLLEAFPGNIIYIRAQSLWNDIVCVLETTEFHNKLRVDEESFHISIIDYFADVSRIKDFHNIYKINVNKIYSYEMYWFLRRHPIQLLEDIADNFDINEKVALGVFIPRILIEAGIPYNENLQNNEFKVRLKTFIDLLFYNLKYRFYTPQSLELMIEAFLCGCRCVTLCPL